MPSRRNPVCRMHLHDCRRWLVWPDLQHNRPLRLVCQASSPDVCLSLMCPSDFAIGELTYMIDLRGCTPGVVVGPRDSDATTEGGWGAVSRQALRVDSFRWEAHRDSTAFGRLCDASPPAFDCECEALRSGSGHAFHARRNSPVCAVHINVSS